MVSDFHVTPIKTWRELQQEIEDLRYVLQLATEYFDLNDPSQRYANALAQKVLRRVEE